MNTDEDMGKKIRAEKSEHEERQRGGRGLFRIFWMFVLFIGLYIGSVGPVMKCSLGDNPFVQRLYVPLYMLCYRYQPAEAFLSWYLLTVWNAPVRESVLTRENTDPAE